MTPGNVDGPDSPHFGRGGWTWYTGSSAWMLRVSTEWILGVRPAYDGLLIEPCLPPGWRGFTMKRRFRGADYDIRVSVGSTRRRVLLDGREFRGRAIPAFGDGRTHVVRVELPNESGLPPRANAHSIVERARRASRVRRDSGGTQVARRRAAGR